MSLLFVIATPIGNLEDVSLRSMRVLAEVGLVAAEDTRVAQVLLERRGIRARLVSYTDHNRHRRIPQLLGRLQDEDVALITDAGTPAISDPGAELVEAARAAGHDVVAVPGPSAVVAALSVSGVRATAFRFVGFLPRSEGDRRRLFQDARGHAETLVAFESPARLRKTLAVVAEVMPERRLAVCRELTKLHEETFVGRAAEALSHFDAPRGEFVVVFEGAVAGSQKPGPDQAEAMRELVEMKRLGLTRAQATALLAPRHGLARRKLYEMWLTADGKGEVGKVDF
jgi:16S rRNA (cytidine1402-2'-O)-methyltransferase